MLTSSSDSSTDDDGFSKSMSKNENMTRKRRRLCSFTNSAPFTRRVPNKKKCDKKRFIPTSPEQDSLASQEEVDNVSTDARLKFSSVAQEEFGKNEKEIPVEKWKNLGRSLRAIADKFANKEGKSKKMSADVNGYCVWTAVIGYAYWKLMQRWK